MKMIQQQGAESTFDSYLEMPDTGIASFYFMSFPLDFTIVSEGEREGEDGEIISLQSRFTFLDAGFAINLMTARW